MTIQKAAYDTCKAIVGAPARPTLEKVIHNLNRGERSLFGYFARHQRNQFLGYLLVDQERDRLTSAPTPHVIPTLSDAEQAALLSGHSQLSNLNMRALEPLLTTFPQVAQATDPYGLALPLRVGLDHTNPPFPVIAFETMAKAFHAHPALKIATETPPALLTTSTPTQLRAQVEAFAKSVRRDGPGKTPSELSDFVTLTPMTSPARAPLRLLAALMTLRASLCVLNQMLFQAVQSNRPPILDRDNIAGIKDLGLSLVGNGVSVTFQPGSDTLIIEPGDLMLLKAVPTLPGLEGLLSLESVSNNLGPMGYTNTVTGRIVNSDLDPYAGFASRF